MGDDHRCGLRPDHQALAEAYHGMLGRVLMLEARFRALEDDLVEAFGQLRKILAPDAKDPIERRAWLDQVFGKARKADGTPPAQSPETCAADDQAEAPAVRRQIESAWTSDGIEGT